RADRGHQQHGARNRAKRRDPPAADSGRVHHGTQDLPCVDEETRRRLHPMRRLGQHPQYRAAGAGPRHDGRHLDECNDLELDAARQGDRPDPRLRKVAGVALTTYFLSELPKEVFMSDLRLTFACGPYDRTQAVRDGTIKPEGIELNYVTLQPAEIF